MLFRSTLLLLLGALFLPGSTGRYINCHADSYADPPPKLELPWGIYEGKPYGTDGKVTVFKNVRFGQAPVGKLRFKAVEFPDKKVDDRDVKTPICMQAGTGDKAPPLKDGESEDCLFLDIYVPNTALKPDAEPLPVVVYLYGGAFFFGYKDTTVDLGSQKLNLYDGKSVLGASNYDFIWVVGNYRVGAFGWLAGTTMEDKGTSNAGLHDQKLLLKFVQEHIEKVKGDPQDVSVWGNSAGASSIMHHLAAPEDEGRPTMAKAVLWSPAFQLAFDRKGPLENTFKSFAKKAGCSETDIDCLREADATKLRDANQAVVKESLDIGIFPFGPALDGKYVKYLPGGLVGSRPGFSPLRSTIVSHVFDEAGLFVPKLDWIKTEEDFQKFLNITFPRDEEIREAITDFYPVLGDDDKKINQMLRVKRVVRDSSLVCNARFMSTEYRGRIWMMQFDFPPGLHGSDLLPLAWNKDIDTGKLIDGLLGGIVNETTRRAIQSGLAKFADTYHKYYAGHAAFGSPNSLLEEADELWEIAESDFWTVKKVLHAGLDKNLKPTYKAGLDVVLGTANCLLWKNIAQAIGDGSEPIAFSALRQNTENLRVQPEQYNFNSWEL